MALRDTQDVLILEDAGNTGHLRDTQDVLIFETSPQGFGHLRDTQDVLIFELPAPVIGLPQAPIVITYPLTVPPGPPGPNRVRLIRMAATAKTESAFTFQQQIQDWQSRRFELEMTWPPMTAAQVYPLQAFLDALQGQVGTFLQGDPLATTPRGSAKGSPITNGATNVSGSNQLVTAGWLPNQAGVLLPRDYIQVQAIPESAGIGDISVAAGVVVLTIFYSSFQVNPISNWMSVNVPFYVSGTGLADGGPFLASSVVFTSEGFQRSIATITYTDPAAINGTGVAGTISTQGGPIRLHRVMTQTPINTDGGGNATIDIFPPIRETLPSGTTIYLQNTKGTFRM